MSETTIVSRTLTVAREKGPLTRDLDEAEAYLALELGTWTDWPEGVYELRPVGSLPTREQIEALRTDNDTGLLTHGLQVQGWNAALDAVLALWEGADE